MNPARVREETKDKLALERYLSHADIHATVYRRLVKRGYLKDEEITEKGKKLLTNA